jgi:hypothetical protein
VVGDGKAGHHLLPLEAISDSRTASIVESAARGGFSMNGEKKGVRNRLLTFVLKFASLVGYGKSKASGSWWFDLSCA